MKENTNSTILLQVSNMVKDIPVCKLSDDDFTEVTLFLIRFSICPSLLFSNKNYRVLVVVSSDST